MANPYQTLGVSRTAAADEIKAAYRKLAKKFHPDLNQGRKDIEQKFKEISVAYDLLSDAEKRARFDRGEIDEMGNERAFSRSGGDPYGNGMGGGRSGSGRNYGGGGADPFSQFNADDIFAEFFNTQNNGGRRSQQPHKAPEVHYAVNIPFVEACLGGKKRISLGPDKTIDVAIPGGAEEGQKLRLRGQGISAQGVAGDAIITLHIDAHPFFFRKDFDILLDAPISIIEAVSGATIKVPTLEGNVAVKTPKNATTGAKLRLKSKGVPRSNGERGDMIVTLKVMLPELPDAELEELLEKWGKKRAYDPRKKLGWS
jgi:DnaJ-class molecular chaperone